MFDRTITALYASRDQAEHAKDQLQAAGLSDAKIELHDQGGGGAASGQSDEGGFMSKVKAFFGGHEDEETYAEGLRRGNVLLTAKIEDDDVDTAFEVLAASDALDVDGAEEEWRGAGWTGGAASGSEQTIPIVEERLKLGQREVERGGVRVRSYLVEKPVHEHAELTEHAEEAVIARDAVVREELAVRDETDERLETLDDTGRSADPSQAKPSI